MSSQPSYVLCSPTDSSPEGRIGMFGLQRAVNLIPILVADLQLLRSVRDIIPLLRYLTRFALKASVCSCLRQTLLRVSISGIRLR